MDVFRSLYGGEENDQSVMSPMTMALIAVAVVVVICVVVYLVWGRSKTENHHMAQPHQMHQVSHQVQRQRHHPVSSQHMPLSKVDLKMSPTLEEFTYPVPEVTLGCNQAKAVVPVTFGRYFNEIEGHPTRTPPLTTSLCSNN